MNTRIMLTATAGATLIASGAFGQTTYSGGGGALVDSGVASFTIDVADDLAIDSFKDVVLQGFSHTWAGDLIITLEHGGTTVTLLDRPGNPESTFGDSADFDGSDYTWTDTGFVYDADLFGSTVPSADPFAPTGGALANFDGMNVGGDWTLSISDNAGGDTGSLGGWSFTANLIPAPGALALLGLAGVVGRRRRR
ncbi:MAG: hypothetical protein HKO59_10765 [Phycisphaerales bacterium]|nr:hypothetical protein [Phycisphaerales bacterium]